MSAVNSVSGTDTSLANKQTSSTEMSDRFMKLLVAQLNNQDPLNPMDNAQVTSQLAQINTVTGINGLNDTVNQLLTQFAQTQSLQAAQLTGHSVLIASNQLNLGTDGTTTQAIGGVSLASAADRVSVEVTDAAGNVVRNIELGAENAGVQRFNWDGKTNTGAQAANGAYNFTVKATSSGNAIDSQTLSAFKVTGVTQTGNVTNLVLNGADPVAYGNVKQII